MAASVRAAHCLRECCCSSGGIEEDFVALQGKRVACEDGSEGYSDLYQENAMLQRDNDTLRLRVKAMQETIDNLNSRVTHLLANEVSSLLAKSSK